MTSIINHCCNTIRKKQTNLFRWSILNFNCGIECANVLPSTSFDSLKINGNSGCLSIKIMGWTCAERYLEVSLSNLFNVIAMTTTLSILDKDGKKIKEQMLFGNGGGVAEVNIFERDRGCLISGECITILCEVILEYYESSTSIEGFVKRESLGHLNDLYTSKKHWDVMFVVAGHELIAHKCILASRCEVFAAMFEHEMKESKSNKVVIDDIDFEVFDEMLRYIYTNEVSNLKENASELLAASEKYNLKDLKRLCEAKLIEMLSIENAIETLMLADLYGAEVLKNYTVDFISVNRKRLANTEEFKKLSNSQNHLLLELYLKL